METVEKFLDYAIINTTDGLVLIKPECSPNSYETHLGNYRSVTDAKKDAVRFFMIARPERFAAQILMRMDGKQTYHDYFAFRDAVLAGNLDFPTEITLSADGNCTMRFLGEPI